MRFSELDIRIARLNAGLSQRELAARVGVKQNYISFLETGRRGLSKRMLSRLTAAGLELRTTERMDSAVVTDI